MIILSPGPANISERVRAAMMAPDICHRGPEFAELLQGIRTRLVDLYSLPDEYRAVVLTGSGTAAIEATVSSLRGGVTGVLFLNNGVYGPRAQQVGERHGIPTASLDCPPVTVWPLSEVRSAVAGSEAEVVYLVHHETTTGVLNPLPEVAEIAHDHNKLLVVDGVSSFAGEELDIAGWGVDAVIGSANKCLRGAAGASFVIANDRYWQRVSQASPGSVYLDLGAQLAAQEAGSCPFTPGIPALRALREALDETQEEGVGVRAQHYRHIALRLREGLANLELELPVAPERRANTMTMAGLPHGWTYPRLRQALRHHGFDIYGGAGEFGQTHFRVGIVGRLTVADIDAFAAALSEVSGRAAGRSVTS